MPRTGSAVRVSGGNENAAEGGRPACGRSVALAFGIGGDAADANVSGGDTARIPCAGAADAAARHAVVRGRGVSDGVAHVSGGLVDLNATRNMWLVVWLACRHLLGACILWTHKAMVIEPTCA